MRHVISDGHSINRVKRAMNHADAVWRKSSLRRAASLYLACRKWLGYDHVENVLVPRWRGYGSFYDYCTNYDSHENKAWRDGKYN